MLKVPEETNLTAHIAVAKTDEESRGAWARGQHVGYIVTIKIQGQGKSTFTSMSR